LIAQPPIQFDRATGVLEGVNAWERLVACALIGGVRISSAFSYRGYNSCANMLRKALPPRDIAIKLNPDATFAFPYGDGYWSKLLERSYCYETELDLLFHGSADVDYTMIDCGANYGYWSVLVSSAPFGAHRVIAIEPSKDNFTRLANNARLNGDRFVTLKTAVGATRGTARLSGTKHEALSIVGKVGSGGEEVPVITLDDLLDDGRLLAGGKYLVKLDVEGVEIDAIKGGSRLLREDTAIVCEEHGNDAAHSVSRFILEHTPLQLVVFDPQTNRFEAVVDLAILDRIKVASNIGYNVVGTASAFWQGRIQKLNASAAKRAQ
jgi:FkbM family methyltransferase